MKHDPRDALDSDLRPGVSLGEQSHPWIGVCLGRGEPSSVLDGPQPGMVLWGSLLIERSGKRKVPTAVSLTDHHC